MSLNTRRRITETYGYLVDIYSQGCDVEAKQSISAINIMVKEAFCLPTISSLTVELDISCRDMVRAQVSSIKALSEFEKPLIRYQGGALVIPSCWFLWHEKELFELLETFKSSEYDDFELFFVDAMLEVYSGHLDEGLVGTYQESVESVEKLMLKSICIIVSLVLAVIGIIAYIFW